MKKSQIKQLDTLWSEIVKLDAGYKCQYCLREGKKIAHDGVWLESAHIIGRTHRATRWGIEIDNYYDLNGMCLCSEHHRAYDEHRPEELHIRKVVVVEERYERLCQTKRIIAKNQDFQKIKERLLIIKNKLTKGEVK